MDVCKRALLIAPSYGNLPQRSQLPGTSLDLVNMRKLTSTLAFDDVKEVTGESANKANILQALDELTHEVEHEDVVLLYYSGHGYYLMHAKDEGLLPACATNDELYNSESEACITGLDLYPYLERLSKKQVRCTVIFDCCHSGQLYRVTELERGSYDEPRVKQIVLEEHLQKKSPLSTDPNKEVHKKGLRGGWTPRDNDHFFYISGCSANEFAFEEAGKGGRLTMTITRVIENLQIPIEKVSIEAFFRLIYREFQERNWDKIQTPQLEGTNLNTALFGLNKIPKATGGVIVHEVNDTEVILSAGCLHNIMAGLYEVFEPTVDKETVGFGRLSDKWLGDIDVLEGHIGALQSSGIIVEQAQDHEKRTRKIAHGCVAYLKTPGSLKHNAFIDVAMDTFPNDHVTDLKTHLEGIKMVNVLLQKLKVEDQDLITITIDHENFSLLGKQPFWVARRRGQVILPPMGLGREELMANNIGRLLRYQHALEAAQSPSDKQYMLENVDVKVTKREKVINYLKDPKLKEKTILDALDSGQDLYSDPTQRPSLMSHSFKDLNKQQLKDESGDALVFQVTNSNAKREDVVHVCVLVYQLDGSITAFQSFKSGRTMVIQGGDTIHDISRVFIPTNSLRKMAQPDPVQSEPEIGIDTMVVYVSSKPADYQALLQTSIQTDPDLLTSRGKKEKNHPLSDWSLFTRSIRPRNLEEEDEAINWVILKKEFAVVKNTAS